jgi:hypothetical protein
MASEQMRGVQLSPPDDKGSVLESLNPRDDVSRIIFSLLGLAQKQIGLKSMNNQRVELERISPPIFSYEYTFQLATQLEGALNYTVQFTRWTEDRIKRITLDSCMAIMKDMAIRGNDNYVSERTWQMIKSIHESSIDSSGNHNGWSKFGIKWSFNDPVYFQMIELVKDSNEETEQTLVFAKQLEMIKMVIEASLSKGYADKDSQKGGMMSLIGDIKQESYTIRETDKKQAEW